jgi:esterase/lipase superfamily enzyme
LRANHHYIVPRGGSRVERSDHYAERGDRALRQYSVDLPSPATGGAGTVVRYGHWGRPVLVFPSEQGRAWDFANNGMVDAVGSLLEAGRAKLYCVDSHDGASWSAADKPMEDRAAEHTKYEQWITEAVVPFIRADSGGDGDILTTGASMGRSPAEGSVTKRGTELGTGTSE